MLLDADCWLHGQVILHQHFLDSEQTSQTKHVLLIHSFIHSLFKTV